MSPTIDSIAGVDDAIQSRRSIRVYLSTPVSRERVLEIPQVAPEEMVECGMSLRHPDPAAAENRLVTERESVTGFVKFLD